MEQAIALVPEFETVTKRMEEQVAGGQQVHESQPSHSPWEQKVERRSDRSVQGLYPHPLKDPIPIGQDERMS